MGTTINIYAGDDKARLIDLRTQVAVAESQYLDAVERKGQAALRLGDGDDIDGLRDAWEAARVAYDEFVDEAAGRATQIELRHLGRRRFRDLRLKHPPRKVKVLREGDEVEETDPEDAPFGFNRDTLPLALLTYVDPNDAEVRTIVSPRMSPRDLEAWLDDELSEGQFDDLWGAAYRDNVGGVGVDPKLSKFYATPQTSDGTSA